MAQPTTPIDPKGSPARRWRRLVVLCSVTVLAGYALVLLPDILLAAPLEVQVGFLHPFLWLLVFAAVLALGPSRVRSAFAAGLRRLPAVRGERLRQVLRSAIDAAHARTTLVRIDELSRWALAGPLTCIAAAVGVALFLTWFPHYLTWAWWADTDQFAVSAQSWDTGLIPYRDLPDFDFPGPIYPLYLLGKCFGWGHPAAFNAFDGSIVALLGLALSGWSRRVFGSALPGVLGYLWFLFHYLGFSYNLVAQRDWHGPFFAVLAILAVQAWPGRIGRAASSLAMGVAFVYRPQVVLFFPAMASALLEDARPAGGSWANAVRSLAEWSAFFAVSLALVFSPLILSGVLDDFVRLLGVARYGGEYNKVTWLSFKSVLWRQLWGGWTFPVLLFGVSLAVAGPDPLRPRARTWVIALLAVLFYKPLSPVPHDYLDQPVLLVRSVTVTPLVAWLLGAGSLAATVRLTAVFCLLKTAVPNVPERCNLRASGDAIRALARGEDLPDPPPGCERFLPSRRQRGARYYWDDYSQLLTFLRRSLAPQARVANLLRGSPFPTINGPSGHLTPFPAAGGFLHLWQVDKGLEEEYAESLRSPTDTVVVWMPGSSPYLEKALVFPRVIEAVRQWYRPWKRFGDLEVWSHVRSDRLEPLATFDGTRTPGDPTINATQVPRRLEPQSRRP
jgi:hypothetical protein